MARRPLAGASLAILAIVVCSSAVAHEANSESVQYLNAGKIMPPNLPFSEAVRVGNTLYLSGAIGNEPGTLKVVAGGIQAEARQVMQNIQRSLEANGYSLQDVVKCTVMLADMSEWSTFNEVYRTFFKEHFPARSAMGVNGLAAGARVEVECM
ncbi:MAG: Rid family detoxifying hydrolase, partial [Gammaproteobacteria bacterium]